jgi:hypothetical protein
LEPTLPEWPRIIDLENHVIVKEVDFKEAMEHRLGKVFPCGEMTHRESEGGFITCTQGFTTIQTN